SRGYSQRHKRKHDDDDDEDPPAEPNQGKQTKRIRTKDLESSKNPSSTKETPKGKAQSKGSKIGKSAPAKELVEEPIHEVVMDDADNAVHDDDQPQDTSEPQIRKLRIQIGSCNLQGLLLLIQNETSVMLYLINQNSLGSIKWSLLQRILSHSITSWPLLLTSPNKLDWNNPEGKRYPFNLSNPLPLQGPPRHRTVAADYFFNNDLKTSDP
ncbi:hypothetical protein Tco_1454837, partial [Tanacetum coccineum]